MKMNVGALQCFDFALCWIMNGMRRNELEDCELMVRGGYAAEGSLILCR